MQFGPRLTPDVIKWMIGACLGVHLGVQYLAPSLVGWLWLEPSAVWEEFAIWQLATAPWMSLPGLSLLFNLLALWMFGSELAVHWGRERFLRYVALCGSGAAAAVVVFAGAMQMAGFDVGWSASFPMFGTTIVALILAYSLLFSDRQVLLFFVVPVRTLYFIPALLFIQLITRAPLLVWIGDLAAIAIGAAFCWQSGETRLTLQMLLHQFRRWRMRNKLRVLDDAEARRQRDRRNLH